LKDYVELVGWKGKAELIEYYKQTDCFLLTSNSEGWGMVVIEAAQYGLPIIMTDVGCAGEVIVDNVSGKVIPVGNLERLVQAMEEILKDQKLRERLGKAGQQKVLELPTFEEVLPRYREVWLKAVPS
jgi:glycosyltransferase involved in cell wall biosynthesis